MNSRAILDQAGRVAIPKPLRDELHLAPGDTFDVTVQGGQVTLRPHRDTIPLRKERGVWVLRTGQPLAATETAACVRSIRARRQRRGTRGSM